MAERSADLRTTVEPASSTGQLSRTDDRDLHRPARAVRRGVADTTSGGGATHRQCLVVSETLMVNYEQLDHLRELLTDLLEGPPEGPPPTGPLEPGPCGQAGLLVAGAFRQRDGTGPLSDLGGLEDSQVLYRVRANLEVVMSTIERLLCEVSLPGAATGVVNPVSVAARATEALMAFSRHPTAATSSST